MRKRQTRMKALVCLVMIPTLLMASETKLFRYCSILTPPDEIEGGPNDGGSCTDLSEACNGNCVEFVYIGDNPCGRCVYHESKSCIQEDSGWTVKQYGLEYLGECAVTTYPVLCLCAGASGEEDFKQYLVCTCLR